MTDALRDEIDNIGFWRQLEDMFRRNPVLRPARRSFRKAKRFVPGLWRQATHQQRALPGAIIAGAQKSGTTQLHLSLVRHPRCFGGATKELHYFSKRSELPLSWYRAQFPLARTVNRVGGICLESTPSYLPTPSALRMMAEVIPEAKLIVLLRDPVARAFSHYQHYKSRGLETRSFEEVVADSINQAEFAPTMGAAMPSGVEPLLDFVHRGYYALQLEVLFDCYPREQALVIDSADLFRDTNSVCQEVFDFLGLEQYDVSPKKVHNRGRYRARIAEETAELLREHYRPYDELLVELLDRRFQWMDVSPGAASLPAAA